MRIFIDIGHPAHVHYFRHFIRIMEERGHTFHISARDKEVTLRLLREYKIKYFSRGKGGNGFFGKILYLIIGDWRVYKAARKFKPDLFLSFASPYAAHASFLSGKPHIAIDDTEVAKFGQFFYIPFTNTILTPKSFKKSFGKKHIRFDSFMELCSLHPKYFVPSKTISDKIINDNNPLVILRFVSWNANHDFGRKGLSIENKRALISELSKKFQVLISSEGKLPEELNKYEIKINPAKIHELMASCHLFISEGATMALECAIMGIPSIYINSITAGTIEEQVRNGLLFSFRNFDGVLEKVNEILDNNDIRIEISFKREKLISEKIDIISFLVWFVETYPGSIKIMKENPDYQYSFK